MKALPLVLVLLGCASQPHPPAAKFSMKGYTLVLLRRGPAWSPEETPESKKLFEGHMANIKAMGKAGVLTLAGPTDVPAEDREAIAGIFILDVTDRGKAEALLANDPAIAAQRLVPTYLPWYGPAGITFPGKE